MEEHGWERQTEQSRETCWDWRWGEAGRGGREIADMKEEMLPCSHITHVLRQVRKEEQASPGSEMEEEIPEIHPTESMSLSGPCFAFQRLR